MLAVVLALAAGLEFVDGAPSHAYPLRPVTLIVPYAAG
jgi:tripartite-type tricarboxylate transporter receptor subunit TctC